MEKIMNNINTSNSDYKKLEEGVPLSSESSISKNNAMASRAKKIAQDVGVALGASTIGAWLMATASRGSLLQLAGSDVVISSLKTMLKKIPHANAKVLLFPALSILAAGTYFADPTRLSTDIFLGLLAKVFSKEVKDWTKGKELKETFAIPKIWCCAPKDDETSKRIKDAIDPNHECADEATKVDITHENGTVTLSGNVSDKETRSYVEKLANTIVGVNEVINNINIEDPLIVEIKNKINPEKADIDKVIFTLQNGVLTLTGLVDDKKAKKHIEAIAKEIAGDKVVNKIEVQHASARKKAVIITAVALISIATYIIPQYLSNNAPASTTIASVYLMNTLMKVITVALREIPMAPELLLGASVAGAGAAVDYGFPDTLTVALFPPTVLFAAQVLSDLAQQYIKGKLDREWFKSKTVKPEKTKDGQQKAAENEESEQLLKTEEGETTQNEEPAQKGSPDKEEVKENKSEETTKKKKKEKKDKAKNKDEKVVSFENLAQDDDIPSLKIRVALVFLAACSTVGANILQPEGGILPQAFNGGWSSMTTKGFIGKPLKPKKIAKINTALKEAGVSEEEIQRQNTDYNNGRLKGLSARSIGYSAVTGTAYGTDLFMQAYLGTNFNLSSIVQAFGLKMITSKEVKEGTMLNYTGVGDSIKNSCSNAMAKCAGLWNRVRGSNTVNYVPLESIVIADAIETAA